MLFQARRYMFLFFMYVWPSVWWSPLPPEMVMVPVCICRYTWLYKYVCIYVYIYICIIYISYIMYIYICHRSIIYNYIYIRIYIHVENIYSMYMYLYIYLWMWWGWGNRGWGGYHMELGGPLYVYNIIYIYCLLTSVLSAFCFPQRWHTSCLLGLSMYIPSPHCPGLALHVSYWCHCSLPVTLALPLRTLGTLEAEEWQPTLFWNIMKAKERYKEKMAEKMKKCAVMRDTYKVPKLPGAQEVSHFCIGTPFRSQLKLVPNNLRT